MVETTTTDCRTETDRPNPVALSLAGGATGTITGLKRGGLPGAVVGGLVGGTVGYLAGVASCESMDVGEPATDSEPISIDTSDAAASDAEPETDADDATDSEAAADADSETDDDADDESAV